ncbi:unnamed protein product [Bursaphelenchus okinawaensis]|uniref:Serpentine receptor class gamma n=1 Tax=Bursaphelenchus okinawaensis TaxID=465554 RepID=A0A811LEV1_9BILA|nr:unnamed protein product [Bursaphelenchus okinawaensis]CAG9121741.1 unnamed protein product [Bursaphelenchus okinawaensis]
MVLETAWEIIKFGYGLPFWFIYLKVVQILRKHHDRDFNTVFYRIVYYTGVSDCIGFWANTLINHWNTTPILTDLYATYMTKETRLISPLYMMTYYTLYISEFSGFLLALNRLSALCYPTKSEKFWRQHFNKILFLYITVPLSVCIHLLFYPIELECPSYRNCYFDAVEMFKLPGRMRVRSALFSITCSVLTLILNSFSIFILAVYRKHDKEMQAQRKLQRYTVCVFIVILVLSLEQVAYVYKGLTDTKNPFIVIFISTYAHLYNAALLMSGVLLLFTSTKIRRYFFRRQPRIKTLIVAIFKGKSSGKQTVVCVTTIPHSAISRIQSSY